MSGYRDPVARSPMHSALRFLLALAIAVLMTFRATPVAVGAAEPLRAEKRIALTFDDVPRAPGAFMTPDARAAKLLAVFEEEQVEQVAFFVNTARVSTYDGDEARIAAYVKAGHVLANHTANHPHLSATSAQSFLADVDAAEAWLKARPGRRPWMRFPFLDEGGKDKAKRDAVREGLKARGLMNGYVTVDGSDWNMEQLAIDAKKAGKAMDMAAFRDLYVETHVQSADFSHDLAKRTLGRAPAQVMLLHETDIAALFIQDLIKALRADGWEIVTADEAFADPIAAFSATVDTPSANGTLTEMVAWEKKIGGPRWYERNDTEIGSKLFRERVLHEGKQ